MELIEEYSAEGVLNGVPAPTQTQCQARGNGVWVEVDGKAECLCYWSAGVTEATLSAVFFIHGDRLWDGKVVGYGDNNSSVQRESAARAAESIGMPLVKIARPGLYGSSGSHLASRQMRELQLVAAAAREIIKRYNIRRYGFAGQSGGGSVAAYLMTQFPDAECFAFTAACLSLQKTSGYDYGAHGIYDPIAHISEVEPKSHRRLFIIGDEQDKWAQFSNLVEFFEAAEQAGHDVTLVRCKALRNHALDATGQEAVAWALQGISSSEIARRIVVRGINN
ncbi:pimeloyl-ACP methyl ester carboxylesterase [Bradyrhizobium sp. USDA 4011]